MRLMSSPYGIELNRIENVYLSNIYIIYSEEVARAMYDFPLPIRVADSNRVSLRIS